MTSGQGDWFKTQGSDDPVQSGVPTFRSRGMRTLIELPNWWKDRFRETEPTEQCFLAYCYNAIHAITQLSSNESATRQ